MIEILNDPICRKIRTLPKEEQMKLLIQQEDLIFNLVKKTLKLEAVKQKTIRYYIWYYLKYTLELNANTISKIYGVHRTSVYDGINEAKLFLFPLSNNKNPLEKLIYKELVEPSVRLAILER